MTHPIRFPYSAINDEPTSLMPRLSLNLSYGDNSVEISGLLDTGSSVNVLPYQIGLALGAIWAEQSRTVQLAGNLARFESWALVVLATHQLLNPKAPARLVFAWTKAEDAPVIFGQMNFFLEFNVCFFRSQEFFEIRPKENG